MRRNRLVAAAVALAMAAGLLSGVVDAGAVRIARPDAPGEATPRALELEHSPLPAMHAAAGGRAAPKALTQLAPVSPTDPDRSVWLPTDEAGGMAVDPMSGRVFVTLQDGVWVFDASGHQLTTLRGLREPLGAVIVGGVLYVAERSGPSITLIDPTTLTVSRRITLAVTDSASAGPVDVAVVGGRIWYLDASGTVVSLDPTTGAVLGTLTTSVPGSRLRTVPGSSTRLLLTDSVPIHVLDISAATATIVPVGGCAPADVLLGPAVAVDATHFVTAPDGLREWSLDGRCLTYTGGDIGAPTFAIAYTPTHGGMIATLSGTVDVYAPHTARPFRHYDLPTDGPFWDVSNAVFSADGDTLYATVQNREVDTSRLRTRLVVMRPFVAPGAQEPSAPRPMPTVMSADVVTPIGPEAVFDMAVDPATGIVFASQRGKLEAFTRTGVSLGLVSGFTYPYGLVAEGGTIVVGDAGANRLVRVDPTTRSIVSTISLPAGAGGGPLAATPGRLWLANGAVYELFGLDPATGSVLSRTSVVHDRVAVVASAPARIVTWFTGSFDHTIIDASQTPPTVVPRACTSYIGGRMATGPGRTVLSTFDDHVETIDVDTGCSTGVDYLASVPSGAALSPDGAYVAVRSTLGGDRLELFRVGEAVPFREVRLPDSGFPLLEDLGHVVAFSADGAWVYTFGSSQEGNEFIAVKVLDDGPPMVSAVSPEVVTTDGGTTVTIEGDNLFAVDGVTIGGVPATSVTVQSGTRVTATVPALPVGYHDVVVHTPGGQSATSLAARVYVVRSLGALGEFTPITPTRLLDTRDGTGQPAAGVVGPGQSIDLTVLGVGGVPSDGVAAVVLNVTVVDPGSAGFLTVYPSGGEAPLASNLNFVAGQTVPNLVTVRVGAGGKVSFYNSSAFTHVLADLAGFFSSSAGPRGTRLYPITPVRVVDTRDGSPLGPGASGYIDLLEGDPDVIEDRQHVKGWVLNVTVTEGTRTSFVTVWPYRQERPLASNLNVARGQTVPNLVMSPASDGGIVGFYNHAGSVHIVADVVGYFDDRPVGEAGRFIPLDGPTRLLDTRDTATPLTDGETRVLDLAASAALPHPDFVAGVIANVTATGATADTFVTVYPAGRDLPLASNLNVVAGQTVPNLVVGRTSVDGGLALYNLRGRTDLVVDVVGWFTTTVGNFAFE